VPKDSVDKKSEESKEVDDVCDDTAAAAQLPGACGLLRTHEAPTASLERSCESWSSERLDSADTHLVFAGSGLMAAGRKREVLSGDCSHCIIRIRMRLKFVVRHQMLPGIHTHFNNLQVQIELHEQHPAVRDSDDAGLETSVDFWEGQI